MILVVFLLLLTASTTLTLTSANATAYTNARTNILSGGNPSIEAVGRSSWQLLHTMAANYPERPSREQKDKMVRFIDSMSEFYPCEKCAAHLRQYIKENPPGVSSKTSLAMWFCHLHNSVNGKLGKSLFDCEITKDELTSGKCSSDQCKI